MALGEIKNGIGPDAYAIYQQVLAAVVERDHPVGSLYISENPTSPAELYGGTWERIEGRFIMGASDTYPVGSTGGSATHTQTENEVAPHKHNVISLFNGSGIKSKTYPGDQESYGVDKIADSSDYGVRTDKNSTVAIPMDILNPYYSAYIWRRVA